MWRTVRIWAAAVFFGGVCYFTASNGRIADALFLVAFVLILSVGYIERSIKELWWRKRDRPPEELDDA